MRSVALTALILTAAVGFPVRAEETERAGQDLFTSQVRPILRGTVSSVTARMTRCARPGSAWTCAMSR